MHCTKDPLPAPNPLVPEHGGQTESALLIARGTRRLLQRLGFSTVTELPLHSGRRADIVALAKDATICIVEIKSCTADFRSDGKWCSYRAYCDRFFFAVPETFPAAIIPSSAGLIVADAYNAEILRPAPEQRLCAATRRAVLLRFAHAAAQRLHRLSDPKLAVPGG